MLENSPVEPAGKVAASGTQAERIAQLRRSLQRLLRRKPTVQERYALDRAARLTARAEAAALDPNTSANDVVRLDNAASKARAAWGRLVAAKPEVTPTLQQYLDERYGGQAG